MQQRTERLDAEVPPPRRFQLELEQLDNGDWRVTAISAID
jgi:hypothetical protein